MLLAFFDFPAELWITCEPRARSKACSPPCATEQCAPEALSPTTARLMVFELVAAKTWRRLIGENQLPKVVAGVRFRDRTEITGHAETRAA